LGDKKNLFFSRALASKSLWRGLMQPRIWKWFLKDKYYPHLSVFSWLRTSDPLSRFGSQSWKNLLNPLPLLVHLLAWKPGAGVSIMIGKDEIMGMGKGSFLSLDLISHLNEHHVYYLFKARRASVVGISCTTWLNSIELGLVGSLASEWERYRILLIYAKFLLQTQLMN
jgi:hypothetical protein